MRYSYVTPRRQTLTLPLPTDGSYRRHTWRLPVSLDEADAPVLSLDAMAASLR